MRPLTAGNLPARIDEVLPFRQGQGGPHRFPLLGFPVRPSLDAVADHYTLTKKTFLAGAQCLKRMSWEMYDPAVPELRQTLVGRHRMEEEGKVGIRARDYISGGVLIARGGRSLRAILHESARERSKILRSGMVDSCSSR